jgi:hypothetical protein
MSGNLLQFVFAGKSPILVGIYHQNLGHLQQLLLCSFVSALLDSSHNEPPDFVS